MKKILICLLLTGSFGAVNAQLKDLMMKKVGEKVSKNKSEKSTTTETNTNSADTTRKSDAGSSNQNGGYNPFMSGGKKEILPQYTFTQNVLMDMKSWDKKGNLETKKSSQMRWYFSNEAYNVIEPLDENKKPSSFSIFESKKSQMVTLMDNDGNKMAMVTKMDTTKMKEKAAEHNAKATIVKTGRTKKVCGYTCEEWTSTDEKGNKTEMWVSSEIPVTMGGSFTMFGQNKEMAEKFNSSTFPKGYMMEMTNYDTNGEKFTMTAIEVNLKAEKVVSTAGYMVY